MDMLMMEMKFKKEEATFNLNFNLGFGNFLKL